MSAGIPEQYPWTIETMMAINDLTPGIHGKAFDPDWFLLRQRFETAEAELQAMTIDRDLWRDAHDEDCPNQAMLESTETALSLAQAQVVRLREALGQFVDTVEKFGNWDDGCFYYNGTSASELQRPINAAHAALADSPDQKEKP